MAHQAGSYWHLHGDDTPKEYHTYLLQCAANWDAGVCCKVRSPEQGDKVRRMAARFARQYKLPNC